MGNLENTTKAVSSRDKKLFVSFCTKFWIQMEVRVINHLRKFWPQFLLFKFVLELECNSNFVVIEVCCPGKHCDQLEDGVSESPLFQS